MAKTAMSGSISKDHFHYLKSDRWKCKEAPIDLAVPLQAKEQSGAHYWREFRAGQPGEFYCKWCYEIRKFRIYFSVED